MGSLTLFGSESDSSSDLSGIAIDFEVQLRMQTIRIVYTYCDAMFGCKDYSVDRSVATLLTWTSDYLYDSLETNHSLRNTNLQIVPWAPQLRYLSDLLY